MNRFDGLNVIEPADTFTRPRTAPRQRRLGKGAVLLAYAVGGWAILVGAVYLVLSLI